MKPIDDGYISDFLIHWAGRGSNDPAEILSIIAETCELLLSTRSFHVFDWSSVIHEKMVCFTDVPLSHSNQHCSQYSRFGIAFHKLKIMNVGAQPVFYVSHAAKADMNIILKYLTNKSNRQSIDPVLFNALERHFYFMQPLSTGRADAKDTFYYEREWRLGSQSLPTAEEWDRPNALYHCVQEGYPPYLGRRVIRDDKEYFSFSPGDVAFLIAPADAISRIRNPHAIQVHSYEELVGKNDEERSNQAL